MEQDSRLSPAVRLLLIAKAALIAGVIAHVSGLRPLDVTMWAVLGGIGTAVLLSLAVPARRSLPAWPKAPAVVVLPDRSAAAASTPDPAVQARAVVVDAARAALLEARQRGAALPELLALADALHEADLDLARATFSAGGWVDPDLRHELALRDRGGMPVESPEQRARQLRVETTGAVRLRDPADADRLRRRTQ